MKRDKDLAPRVAFAPGAQSVTVELADLVDVKKVQELMDDFHALTGLPMSIIGRAGEKLVGVGWQEICTRFHRVHPVTATKCRESDLELSRHVPAGTFKAYKCKNNMWDIVTPIIIGGTHAGNVFMGQFFFTDEVLDYQVFREQARRYGFPEKEYLEALDQVPRLDRATVNRAMSFFTRLAHLISRMGYSNMRLREFLQQRNRLLQSLEESEERWQFALEGAGDGVWDWNAQTNEVFFSRKWKALLGYQDQEIENSLEEWKRRVHPHDREHCFHRMQEFLNQPESSQEFQCRLQCQDGSYKWFLIRGRVMEWGADGNPLRVIGT